MLLEVLLSQNKHFLHGWEMSGCFLFSAVIAAKGLADAMATMKAQLLSDNFRDAQSTSGLCREHKYRLLHILWMSIKFE